MDVPAVIAMDGFIPHSDLGCPDFEVVKIGDSAYTYSRCGTAWHREWMTPYGRIAVGLNDDGSVDEVLFDDAHCHLEMMSDQCIWMQLNGRYVFHFTHEKGRRICLNYSYDDGED
jgi:hypothetical protein